jgi:hypothetical protein
MYVGVFLKVEDCESVLYNIRVNTECWCYSQISESLIKLRLKILCGG